MEDKIDYTMPHICFMCGWNCFCDDQPCSCCKEDKEKEAQHNAKDYKMRKKEVVERVVKHEIIGGGYANESVCPRL
jgi:hypothetical protein